MNLPNAFQEQVRHKDVLDWRLTNRDEWRKDRAKVVKSQRSPEAGGAHECLPLLFVDSSRILNYPTLSLPYHRDARNRNRSTVIRMRDSFADAFAMRVRRFAYTACIRVPRAGDTLNLRVTPRISDLPKLRDRVAGGGEGGGCFLPRQFHRLPLAGTRTFAVSSDDRYSRRRVGGRKGGRESGRGMGKR